MLPAAVAWLAALCAGVRIVTFWDVLRVDLGANPQDSILLIHELSAREACTVAAILTSRTW